MHSSRYQPHIDGLRAIAVLAVLVFHFAPDVLPGGFLGVDVFFVVSGFVVASSCMARGPKPFAVFVGDFVARRIRRIVPALVVCLLVTSTASSLWIPKAWLSDNIPDTGRAAFFGLSNVVLYRSTGDYFSHVASYNPFTHTWSLAVEEQFYLIAPIFLWLCTRGGRTRLIGAGLFALASLCSFAYAYRLAGLHHPGAYYLLTSRFWELGAGVLLCVLARGFALLGPGCDQSPGHWRIASGVLALAALITTIAVHVAGTPTLSTTLWVVGATTMLLGCLQGVASETHVGRLLSWRPMRYVGKMSYSLYLWHWPVIVLFRWTVGLDGAFSIMVAVALTSALAWISSRWIEGPASRSFPRLRPARTIVAGVSITFFAAVTAQTIQKQQHRLSPSVVAQHRDDWYPSRGQALRSPDGCAVARTYTRTPHGWHGTFERSGCDSVRSGPSVFVVGDSHALAYGPMFARYTMDTGSQVTVYNNGGCPMLSLQPQREASEHCRASASMVLADVLGRLRRGDVVFLPSLRLPRYVDQGVMQADDAVASMVSGREATDARTAAIAPGIDLVQRLTRAGAQVVIQAPNLILRAPPYRCADWWTAGNPICARGTAIDRAMFESLRAPVLAALAEIVDADESVTLFDPLPSLCPSGEVCSGFRNGRPLFFDGDHLSAYGNHAVYPAFLAAMRAQARAMSMPAPTTAPMGACAQRMAPAKAPGGCSGVDVLPERQPMSPAV